VGEETWERWLIGLGCSWVEETSYNILQHDRTTGADNCMFENSQ
jgi:hypothetical protein